MNLKKSLFLVVMFLLPFIAVEANEQKSLELPGIQVIPIQDTKSDRQYELYIKLPEGYPKDNDVKYPVIYITDAKWHIEILSGSTEHVVENAILVGISWQKGESPALSRHRDYTFMKSRTQNTRAEKLIII
jgi:predicted alpha/beta superfamily hydrolase